MGCPKCNSGFIYFENDLRAVEEMHDGAWHYYSAYCGECDWTGFGRVWFKRIIEKWEDGVELPEKEEERIIIVKEKDGMSEDRYTYGAPCPRCGCRFEDMCKIVLTVLPPIP